MIRRVIDIYCDACVRHIVTPWNTQREARSYAHRYGWWLVDSDDLCPFCAAVSKATP